MSRPVENKWYNCQLWASQYIYIFTFYFFEKNVILQTQSSCWQIFAEFRAALRTNIFFSFINKECLYFVLTTTVRSVSTRFLSSLILCMILAEIRGRVVYSPTQQVVKGGYLSAIAACMMMGCPLFKWGEMAPFRFRVLQPGWNSVV